MWVLALDTTLHDGSVALVRDDAIVLEMAGDPAWSHAERLPADVRTVLEQAGVGLADVGLIAVATGPGAFTGLRIGLAAAQGLALALDRPAAGVPTLAAIAWHTLDATPGAATVATWLDASRGEVYAAAYGRPDDGRDWPLTSLAAPSSASPADTLQAWAGVVPAATPVAAAPAHADAIATAGFTPVTTPPLIAGLVGRLAMRMQRLHLTGPPAALAPEYVRRPDVEIARDRQRAPSTA